MLTTGTSATVTSFSSPRQIAVTTNISSQVMYTVPTGKKFQGTIHSNNGGQTVGITPSGGAMAQFAVPTVNTSYSSVSPMPITLVAGTVLTNFGTSGQQYLIGVETDA